MNRFNISRRRFLLNCLNIGFMSALSTQSWALPVEKRLHLYQPYTDETLDLMYYSEGGYHLDSLQRIDYLMRDYRTDDVMPMDLKLLDTLYELQQGLAVRQPLYIISAYRCEKTNRQLRKRSRNVAQHSFHLKGRAVDVRLPGVSSRQLKRAAMRLKRGGVGHYSRSGFVHLDTGPVRHW